MTVEVIIPVYRPGEAFWRLLRMLKKQTYGPVQVMLLVTESGEDFAQIAMQCVEERKELPQIRLIKIAQEHFDHGGTRHLGAMNSQADILLYMTQDAVPRDEYLIEEMVQAMETHDKVAGVYARQLPASDCNPIERYTRQFNYPSKSRIKTKADLPELGIKTYFCSNVCAAYRRAVYQQLGGFEERTIFNEDMIYAAGLIQAGYSIAYAAEAQVVHSHNYSGMQQLHRNFDLAVSQADHPEIFEGVPSEGEGIRMVKSTAAWLCKKGKIYLLPKLVWQSGCKYLGYLLGKRYRSLPKKLVLWLSMNKRYWNQMNNSRAKEENNETTV